jgi:hypothetical protein
MGFVGAIHIEWGEVKFVDPFKMSLCESIWPVRTDAPESNEQSGDDGFQPKCRTESRSCADVSSTAIVKTSKARLGSCAELVSCTCLGSPDVERPGNRGFVSRNFTESGNRSRDPWESRKDNWAHLSRTVGTANWLCWRRGSGVPKAQRKGLRPGNRDGRERLLGASSEAGERSGTRQRSSQEGARNIGEDALRARWPSLASDAVGTFSRDRKGPGQVVGSGGEAQGLRLFDIVIEGKRNAGGGVPRSVREHGRKER